VQAALCNPVTVNDHPVASAASLQNEESATKTPLPSANSVDMVEYQNTGLLPAFTTENEK